MPPEEEVADVGSESAAVETASSPEVDSSPVESSQASAAPAAGGSEVWGAFRQLPQFQGADDRAIASRLYEALQREQSATHALQQYQSIIPVASEYLSNKDRYEQWLASQQQQQAAPAPQQQPVMEESPWWNPPKVRDAYKQYLVRDENGREIISPEAPLDARHALAEYQSYKANFAQKFLEDPQAALGPMVEKIAVERAESIVQERLGRMKDEEFVSTLERDNADWLYDQNGNASAEGLLAQKYIQEARSLGIQGAKARWEFATRMVERDLLLNNMRRSQQPQQAMQQAPQPAASPAVNPADAAAQKNMEFLRAQAMRTASQRPAATSDPRIPTKPMTFAEKLAANLQSAGYFS